MKHIIFQFSNKKFYIMVFGDIVLIATSLLFSYLLRFDFAPQEYLVQALQLLPFVLGVKIFFFFVFGLYRGMWRYTSLEDLLRLFMAALIGETIIIAGIAYLYHFQGFPRSVFAIDFFLSLFFCGGLRVGIRAFYAWREGSFVRGSLGIPFIPAHRGGRPVLIIGAGKVGEKVCREILERNDMGISLVGFVDDASEKINRLIHGVPVLGSVSELPSICSTYEVQEVFIATPSASGDNLRRIVEACEQARVRYKTLPAMSAIMDGKVSIKSLRDVDYADLLGRAQVELDTRGISDYLFGKTVLVTGAGGSIGSELCRQIIRFSPGKLVLLDASEANLYTIEMELVDEYLFKHQIPILGQCQDKELIDDIFKCLKPEVVFHAAAYKHVPILESNPWQAVENNIWGTYTLMQAAQTNKVERFVVVSTDKAVRPTNVMGVSKRITELLMHAFCGNSTRFMAVRFGNVIGSSGSVIPLFRRQIEHGGPVTVTHPEVTRYFMTVEEAVQLILQAGSMGKGGEIFVLKMGVPIRISDMARDLIRLSGKEPDKDISITYTGLRPGEKLYEELITQGEGISQTMHEKIMVLNYDQQYVIKQAVLFDKLQDLRVQAANRNVQSIKEGLAGMVKEYKPQAWTTVFMEEKKLPTDHTDEEDGEGEEKEKKTAHGSHG